MPKHKYDFDLIVIGSGAGGAVGAHYATSLGKKVAIFEKGEIGGECPNWACVPTKAILHASEVYKSAGEAEFFGTELEDRKLDYKNVKKWRDLVVSRTGAEHGKESLEDDGIRVIQHKATFISPHQVEAGGHIYSAEKFLLATGSYVFIPPIEGLKETGYITFKEAADFTKLPKSIFILGGGPIGCEFTQAFNTFGVDVVLADSLDHLIAKEDPETSGLVEALFENRGVKVLTGIAVKKIEKKGRLKVIHYQKGDTNHKVEVEEILISTGKRPVLDFGLDKASLIVDEGHLKVDKYLQTNVPHIYAAGDLVGPFLFTPTGYYQSKVAVHNAYHNKKIIPDYSVLTRCVFTNPEIASVGITETHAKEIGLKVKVGITPTAVLGRANTSNEFDGFIKVITDVDGVVIGAAIVAPHAGEIIHELALAIKAKIKASVIADMIHAYPTFSEGIKLACGNIE